MAGTIVTGSNATVSPLFRVPLLTGLFDIGGIKTVSASINTSTRTRAMETVTRWNAIERHVMTLLANGTALDETALTVNDPKVLGVLLDTWRKLPTDDPRNVDFDKAATMLELTDAQRRQLKSTGVTSLSGIATALQVAPGIERQNIEVQRVRALFRNRKVEGTLPEPVKFSVSSKDSAAIIGTIGAGLAGGH